MPETFLRLGSHLIIKQGNEANCPKFLKNFVEMATKYSLVRCQHYANTIEHDYQFLTTPGFIFSRDSKNKMLSFLDHFSCAISQNEWHNERKQTKTRK